MSATHTNVREATSADAAVLARLLTVFNAEFDAEFAPLDVIERRYAQVLDGPDFVAYLAGNPAVGFATIALRPSIYREGRVSLMEDLYVAPSLRNQGIGSMLINAVLARAETEGWGAVEIQVDESDVDTMRFYERHGFISRDPQTGDRALLWRRDR